MATNATSQAHTPGPWTADAVDSISAEHECEAYRIDGNSQFPTVASVYHREGDGEARANARLIAAAPDLLAACNAALDLLSDLDDEPSGEAFTILAAAVNKAEGSSPEPDHANAA